MQLTLADETLFGNDAGEEEQPEILASYFVDQKNFNAFFNRGRRLSIARSRKGMGKSALLAYFGYNLQQSVPEAIIIHVTGADLTAFGEFSSKDPAFLINQWQQAICARITQEIGTRIRFAFNDTSMLMVESAELAGLKNRNIVRALVDRLKGKLGPIEITRPEISNYLQQLKRYEEVADKSTVWLLVDDIDSTFIDSPEMRLKIGTFFSACRKISREVNNINIRASVRTDVWTVIRDNEDLDKAEQYIIDIRWTKHQMETLLAKRILAYIQRELPRSVAARQWRVRDHAKQIIESAFVRRVAWAGTAVTPVHALNILSARRPRWMTQLCRLAGGQADRSEHHKIESTDFKAVLPRFSELRIQDLYKEHGHQFSGLKHLIEIFARGQRIYNTEELLTRIKTKYLDIGINDNPVSLEGRVVRKPMELAHFLFRIGFLQAQKRDGRLGEFVDYEQRPDLLTTEVNPDDGLDWAVYPSYRNVLRIK